jgi:hypothetical protein
MPNSTPPDRRPGQPPGPPPLPTLVRGGGPNAPAVVRPAGRPATAARPVLGWPLLAAALVGAAVVGGGLVALIGPPGGGQRPVAEQAAPPPAPPVPAVAPPKAAPELPGAAETAAAEPSPPAPAPDPAQERQNHFAELKARVEAQRHLPVGGGLEAGKPKDTVKEQTLKLCSVGQAEVELSLPNLGAFGTDPQGYPWVLSLEGPGPDRTICASAYGVENPPRHELARVAIADDKTLSLTLLPLPDKAEPAVTGLWPRFREALLTAPLVLRLPAKPGQPASAEFETYIQLCRPKRLDPITIEKLLTKGGNEKSKPEDFPPLPATPWTCAVELEGKAGEGIVTTSKVVGSGQKIAHWSLSEPVTVKATWALASDPKEPFMETDISLQNRPEGNESGTGVALEIRCPRSHVLMPWSTPKRVGELEEFWERAQGKPAQSLPALPAKMPSTLSRVPEGDEMSLGELVSFLEIAGPHLKKHDKQAEANVRQVLQTAGGRLAGGESAQTRGKPLAFWKEAIRMAVRATPGYQAWTPDKVPPPGPQPKPGNDPKKHEAEVKAWEARKLAYERFLNPFADPKLTPLPEEKFAKFWASIQAQPIDERPQHETMLCSLYYEIDSVLPEKRKAKRLLEAVKAAGGGTVEFTGRVWVDPMNNGEHRLLLAEFAAPTAAAPAPAAQAAAVAPPSETPATPAEEAPAAAPQTAAGSQDSAERDPDAE